MSKIFYDSAIDLSSVEKNLKKAGLSTEDREELYQIIDEMVHHRVLGCILDRLPKEHHEEFLTKFSERPHDENLFEYLRDRIIDDVEEFIKAEIRLLSSELLMLIEESTRSKEAK